MAISVKKVGHVVLKVRDLERSAAFYRDVIGLKEVARGEFAAKMVFFSATGDNHHDLALAEVGRDAPGTPPNAVGLSHVALKIGDTLDELRAARAHLASQGITKVRVIDHRVSQSIYLNDPDGNAIELYVDADPAIWRGDPTSVAHAQPLSL
jgi:catechol-2,3-dioxygenase